MSSALRLARTPFPELEDKASTLPDQWARGLWLAARRLILPGGAREVARFAAAQAHDAAARLALTDEALRSRLRAVAPAAYRGGDRAACTEAMLLVGEASRRTIGLQPYPVQLFAAAVLLSGRLAEMQTGEGKTLTAGLAASVSALAGVPTHVVTVNDYLAERDAGILRPLFTFLGLSVGVVHQGIEPALRRQSYACDVAYCTNKELVFDYLRDRVAAGGSASAAQLRARRLFGEGGRQPLLLRGLYFAIVDECDSILIDEARTPLILAEKAGEVEHAAAYPLALTVAGALEQGRHWTLNLARRELRLTDLGREVLGQRCAGFGPPWGAAHAREHLAVQALRAQHLFLRDRHYLVDAENKVQIIDEYTGRVLPGRTWEQGLHQMIEAKEGVDLSEQTQTLARITYQRYFSRYLRLAGMTGTASEAAREMAAVYRLEAVAVPTHRPCIRVQLPDRLCADAAAKWQAVADIVAERRARGQPVLIGTRSVEASEHLSRVLQTRDLPHQVLNARQDAQEAAIVSRAGQRGAITVATNMAGRGTDIGLGDGVAASGGLCVVLTEFHESSRIDRQFFGRCARQGDRGEAVAVVALDDDLFRMHGQAEAGMLRLAFAAGGEKAAIGLARTRAAAQRRAERIHARTRRDTLRHDRQLDRMLSLSGHPV